jgi:hypothetical protein
LIQRVGTDVEAGVGSGWLRHARGAGRRRDGDRRDERATRESHARSIAVAFAIASLAAGCAWLAPPKDLASAAIAERGGAVPAYVRESDLRAYEGFQGAWSWELAYAQPEHLSVALHTAAEDQRLETDGITVRTYVGRALVSTEPARTSAVAALARFVALTSLDVLLDSERIAWQELPESERPAGAARALRAHFRDAPGHALRLGFDADARLLVADGTVAVPGLGEGPIEARFADYRRVGGRRLPFEIRYRFRGAPLLDERVRSWRID